MNIVNQVPIHFAFIVFDSYKDGMKTLRRFNMGLILYTLFIIVWGAWVRISKSGDGCGEHWPLCHGEWIPSQKPIETWIEFGHRASTGIYGILILIFIYMVFK
ncbi:MAG: COX15/CtaA family protein, partial [Bdellovibrionales bacterium]